MAVDIYTEKKRAIKKRKYDKKYDKKSTDLKIITSFEPDLNHGYLFPHVTSTIHRSTNGAIEGFLWVLLHNFVGWKPMVINSC